MQAGKLDDDAPIVNPKLPDAAKRMPLYALGQKVRVKFLRDDLRAVDFKWSENIKTVTDIRQWNAKAGWPNCYHVDYEDDYWLHEDDLMPVNKEEWEDYVRRKSKQKSLKPDRERVVPDAEHAKRMEARQKEYSKAALKAHKPLPTAELRPPKTVHRRLAWRERQPNI